MNQVLLLQSALSDEATATVRSALPNAPTVPATDDLPRLSVVRLRAARRLHALAGRIEPVEALAA